MNLQAAKDSQSDAAFIVSPPTTTQTPKMIKNMLIGIVSPQIVPQIWLTYQ